MGFSALVAAVLVGCAGQLESINARARQQWAPVPNSCKEHTVHVLDELDRVQIPNAVLWSCTPWMLMCHVSAIAYVGDQALVVDNGALGFSKRTPRLEDVLAYPGRYSIYSAEWLRQKLREEP